VDQGAGESELLGDSGRIIDVVDRVFRSYTEVIWLECI